MSSIFAQRKLQRLDEVKAEAEALTKQRIAFDMAQAEAVNSVVSAAPKRKDVSNIPEAEVVEAPTSTKKK